MSRVEKLTTKALRERVARESGGEGQPAWCVEHDDMGWLYNDNSGKCIWAYVVETGGDECRFVPVKLSVDNEHKSNLNEEST
jgi:hypothetical protein